MPEKKQDFAAYFDQKSADPVHADPAPAALTDEADPILGLIEEYGFAYVDKRPNGGSLWVIAGQEEGKEFVEACRRQGVSFEFALNGGRATQHQPAWYSKKE